jgi:hypothetical protein
MPHDDGSKQTPSAWQDGQTPAGWQDGEGLDPDHLPWTVAPTSVPPDMTTSERYSTSDATIQMPKVPRQPAAPQPHTPSPTSEEAPAEAVPAAGVRPPTDDATVLLPRDPSASGRGRRRRGDAAKRAVARAIGIAKVSYNRTTDAEADKDKDQKKAGSQPPSKAPIPQSGSNGSVIAIFAILAVLVVSGIAAVYMTPKDNTPAPAQPNPQAPRGATATNSPSPSPSMVPSMSAAAASPRRSLASPSVPPQTVVGDVTTARAGECFVNLGTDSNPNMQKVVCRSGSLKVIQRIDGVTEMKECEHVANSTNFFSFQVNGDQPMSFVLCMRSV